MFYHRNTQDRVFEDYFLRTPIHLASPSAIIQFKIILDNSLHVAILKFKFLGFTKNIMTTVFSMAVSTSTCIF